MWWCLVDTQDYYQPQYIIPTATHGSGSITVSGCWTAKYREILEENLFQSARASVPVSFTFCQDKAPKHSAISGYIGVVQIQKPEWVRTTRSKPRPQSD